MEKQHIDNIEHTLTIAIRKEDEAYNQYSNFAKSSQNNNLRLFFTKLAFEELKHEKLIREFIKTGSFEEARSLVEEHNKGHGLMIVDDLNPMEEATGVRKAFFHAIEKETAAIFFYEKLRRESIDSELNSVLDFLIEEEKNHERLLKNEMKKYSA